MLKTIFPVAALALLAACQSAPPAATNQPAALPTVAAPPAPASTHCYGYAAQDTVYLALSTTQPAATGTLIYHYAGKDRNRGTIAGSFHGDTLRADYTFQSEGVQSMREVVFVRRGAGLVEGYGPVTERNGKTVFQRPQQLKFDTKTPLALMACR